MIIDCHGHQTLAPRSHLEFRETQLARLEDPSVGRPIPAGGSDDEIREIIEANQLRLIKARGGELTLFSPRASKMEHHVGDAETVRDWARVCNDLVFRVTQLYPENFAGVCMLPQRPDAALDDSIEELKRCVDELGFVGCNLNPDPSGGRWTAPSLIDRYWYPLYETLVELEVPAMIHVSGSCNPAMHATGSYYIAADTNAFMQFLQGDLFKDFPELKLIIPHGGGAVPYHWGRYRGLADMLKRPPLAEHVMRNVYFDTCVYHQPGIDLLFRVIDVDNILFGSEMVGAVRGIDPETGQYFDDTKRYIDALELSEADRAKVFEGNARRVYPRLDTLLKARGP
jgi:4-oxalmesaconate hydratase